MVGSPPYICCHAASLNTIVLAFFPSVNGSTSSSKPWPNRGRTPRVRKKLGLTLLRWTSTDPPLPSRKLPRDAAYVVGNLLECFVLLLPRSQIKVCCAAIKIRLAVDARFVNGHEPFRVRIGQRPE